MFCSSEFISPLKPESDSFLTVQKQKYFFTLTWVIIWVTPFNVYLSKTISVYRYAYLSKYVDNQTSSGYSDQLEVKITT